MTRCNWCEEREGITIGKKAICWECANNIARYGGFNSTEKMYLQAKFRKMFGEEERI